MSRGGYVCFDTPEGFPRVSGDEPLKNNSWGYYPWFSPRERG